MSKLDAFLIFRCLKRHFDDDNSSLSKTASQMKVFENKALRKHSNQLTLSPFQLSVAFHIETTHLFRIVTTRLFHTETANLFQIETTCSFCYGKWVKVYQI